MDEEGESKSGQAYQVIGYLVHFTGDDEDGPVSDAELIRALDYFAASEQYDDEFLPWPRSDR